MSSINNPIVVNAKIGDIKYLTTITAGNKQIIGDEPESLGGSDKGFSPYELLASALSMCTAATLKMYTDRKNMQVGEISVTVDITNNTTEKVATFNKHIAFENKDLSEADLKRLKTIAEACPVNKLLSNNIVINTSI